MFNCLKYNKTSEWRLLYTTFYENSPFIDIFIQKWRLLYTNHWISYYLDSKRLTKYCRKRYFRGFRWFSRILKLIIYQTCKCSYVSYSRLLVSRRNMIFQVFINKYQFFQWSIPVSRCKMTPYVGHFALFQFICGSYLSDKRLKWSFICKRPQNDIFSIFYKVLGIMKKQNDLSDIIY